MNWAGHTFPLGLRKMKLRACQCLYICQRSPTPGKLGTNPDLSNSRASACSRRSSLGASGFLLCFPVSGSAPGRHPSHPRHQTPGSSWPSFAALQVWVRAAGGRREGGGGRLASLTWRWPSEFLSISSQPPGPCQWSLLCRKLYPGCLFSLSGVKPVW